MIAAMEDGEANSRTKKSTTSALGKGVVLYHASQGADGKAGCLTVFWVEYTKASVTILAVGAHDGSSSYDIDWYANAWPWGNKVALSLL